MQHPPLKSFLVCFAAKVFDPPSGQYIFSPDGLAQPFNTSRNRVFVIRGPVRQQLIVQGSADVRLLHTVKLDQHEHGLALRNEFDIRSQLDFELGMRLRMGEEWSAEGEQFYTDLNGFSVSMV